MRSDRRGSLQAGWKGMVLVLCAALNPARADEPHLVPDVYLTYRNTPLTVPAPGVLANDVVPSGGTLTLEVVSPPAPLGGTVTLENDGRFTYTPAFGLGGTEEFGYTVSDGTTTLGPTAARIEVYPPGLGEPPRTTVDRYVAYNGGAVLNVSNAEGVLSNDIDETGDVMSAHVVTGADHGRLLLSMFGGFEYEAEADFVGTDRFIYHATDNGVTFSAPAQAVVQVLQRGSTTPPSGTPDAYIAYRNTTLAVIAPGVLGNDTDTPGDALTVRLVEAPSLGEVRLDPFGSFEYTPQPDVGGTDRFTYQVTDGRSLSEPITVRIEVRNAGSPPAPTAVADRYVTYNGGASLQVSAPGVLANDPDPTNDLLSAHLVAATSQGQVGLAGLGGFFYRPAPGFVGTDSFTYRASDGVGESAPASVTLEVLQRGSGAAPVGQADRYLAFAHVPLTVISLGVLGNDEDAESDSLTAILETPPTKGILALDPRGGFTYHPGPAGVTDHFTYRVSDGNSVSEDPIRVEIAVIEPGSPLDPPPVANDDVYVAYNQGAVLQVADPGVLANDVDTGPLAVQLLSNPEHGQLGLSGYGGFQYRAAFDFEGTDYFAYRARDGQSVSNQANVVLFVLKKGSGQAPVGGEDAYTVRQGKRLTLTAPGVLVNDHDAEDEEVLSVALDTAPRYGTLTMDALGGFSYLPPATFIGDDEFYYRLTDGNSFTRVKVVLHVVENRPPVANGDSFAVAEDSSLNSLPVRDNDSDPDGDSLTVVANTAPAHGTVTCNSHYCNYAPARDFHGNDSFSYTVGDTHGGSATATVQLTVTPSNDSPVAQNDSVSVPRNAQRVFIDVLANDTDPDAGDALVVVTTTQPANGTVELLGGSVNFTPTADFTGATSFTYAVSDGISSDTATVNVSVDQINHLPVAREDQFAVAEDSTATVLPLLANDSDLDVEDVITISTHTAPAHGTAEWTATDCSYTPAPDFHGTDTFSYTIDDGHGGIDTASITVMVDNVDDLPVAADDHVSVEEDSGTTALQVLINDSDPDGDALTLTGNTSAAHGFAACAAGVCNYTPAADFHGNDSFSYTVGDDQGGSATATVNIVVTPVNDPPNARDDVAAVARNAQHAFIDVLVNDSDPDDGDSLTVTAITQPPAGAVVLSNGNVYFTPATDASGTVSFAYTMSDGVGSDSATVTVTVDGTNDAPVATDDDFIVEEDSGATTLRVLANDSDPNVEDVLSLSGHANAAHGTVVCTTRNCDYTPNTNFHGSDSFTYTIDDGRGGSATATVQLTVSPVNDAPEPQDDAVSVAQNAPAAPIPVLINDSDVDGDALVVAAVTQPSHGSAILADGVVSFQPVPDFSGTTSFTYTVSDGVEAATATVTVSVQPADGHPIGGADGYSIPGDVTLVVHAPGVLANDIDPDNDPLTAQLQVDTLHGVLSLAADGSFTYVPGAGFVGIDGFVYQANDGEQSSPPTEVILHVGDVIFVDGFEHSP